ncbi:MAG: hypothetical protein AAF610_12585 [Pseudomonadota bacterium]
MNLGRSGILASSLGLALGGMMAADTASAATYRASQDTYVYEFLGAQGVGDGDSGGVLVWNHESIHGGKGLIQFDSDWRNDPAILGGFTATLNIYSACSPSVGGFIGACAGDSGTPLVMTDVILQPAPWSESDPLLTWLDIAETGPLVSFSQTEATGWINVDVTALVQLWLDGTPEHGFSLSQENYQVLRADNGSIAVSVFCDSESSRDFCSGGDLRPFLSIDPLPDADGDGISDNVDNCLEIANASQLDGDNDGYGNACDADLNNDCSTNAIDLGLFRAEFFGTSPIADLDGNGTVNFVDLGIFRTLFFSAPGPSGTTNVCN